MSSSSNTFVRARQRCRPSRNGVGSHLISPPQSQGKGPLGAVVAVDPVAVMTMMGSSLFGQFPVQQADALYAIKPEG